MKNFDATKPQDKIYGALGLIERKWREQFVERFGVHTDRPVANVYHDASIYLLECEKSSTFFYDFPIGRQSHSVLPSWVPNFNADIYSQAVSRIRLGDMTSKHLGIPRENIKISEDRVKLSTRGLIMDQVNKLILLQDRPLMNLDMNETYSSILKILRLLHLIQTLIGGLVSYEECKVPSEPLWKTLVAGCYAAIDNEDLKDETGCQMRIDEWMAIPPDAFEDHIATIVHKANEKPLIIQRIEDTLTPGRCFFSGEQGSYGISEPGAQAGDVVALLFPEHFIPFILRKIGDDFEMVGTAYIPEPFKEAVIKNFREDRRILRDFVII